MALFAVSSNFCTEVRISPSLVFACRLPRAVVDKRDGFSRFNGRANESPFFFVLVSRILTFGASTCCLSHGRSNLGFFIRDMVTLALVKIFSPPAPLGQSGPRPAASAMAAPSLDFLSATMKWVLASRAKRWALAPSLLAQVHSLLGRNPDITSKMLRAHDRPSFGKEPLNFDWVGFARMGTSSLLSVCSFLRAGWPL